MDVNIFIDPTKLSNPDTDLRYLIPDKAATISGGKLEDDGYDYDDEDRMIISLVSSDLSEAAARQHLRQVFLELALEDEALTVEVVV